ncbi:MAG: thioredoxin family protein, partial [Verrucomicrobiota bacterium]|nr:thioredoxin family protein [Verrucomicrobiota bacterium]
MKTLSLTLLFSLGVTVLAADNEEFTPGRLEEKLRTGAPVFIEFTADWCLNCKAIEKSVLETEPVRAAFREKKVVPLKADWTNGNKEITQLLKTFGRTGIPTYVLYPGGNQPPIVLPEILTQELLLKELGMLKETSLTPAVAASAIARNDDAPVPLDAAVRELNEHAAADPIGKAQPPLTEDAVIAAIRWELLNREKLEVSDGTARVLEAIPQTRALPKGLTLETDQGYEPNDRVTFEAWAVRLRIPGGPH